MISFLNNDVRTQFHTLPIDKQKEWMSIAEDYDDRGFDLKILYVERVSDKVLEVSIRLDEKFDIVSLETNPP